MLDLDLSPIQQEAVNAVSAWYEKKDKQVFKLFGYAGTGKTTLARHFADTILGERERALYAAYTGKAAHVLRTKGCRGASTIHRLIYKTTQDDKGKLHFSLDDESSLVYADLLILDEVSMVGEKIAEDLESFGTPLLVLGDPAQLPPIQDAGYYTNGKPDIMLTEIHRQAEGNSIIEMATKTRNQCPLGIGKYGDSAVIFKMIPELCLEADQMIVGKNVTRRSYNQAFRRQLGLGNKLGEGLPEVSDKIICLRNNHEMGLLNGSIWSVDKVKETEFTDKLLLDIRSEERTMKGVEVHKDYFLGGVVHWREELDANSFDYGYAITCHKSQGSQWDNVVIIDESAVFGATRWKWLYTAITRAAEKVTIFMGG